MCFTSGYTDFLKNKVLSRFDQIKISGKLTKDIQSDKDNQLFVSSLLSIARGLGINVIAELVENEEESVALTQLDVAYQQGFYFAKPTLWQH